VIHLDEVLQMCPNLSELTLAVNSFRLSPAFQPQALQLTCLRILIFPTFFNFELYAPMLRLLRLAPILSTLSLDLSMPNGQDLINLVQLAGQGHLQNLEEVEVSQLDLENFCEVELGNLIQSFVSDCAKLHTLDLSDVDDQLDFN